MMLRFVGLLLTIVFAFASQSYADGKHGSILFDGYENDKPLQITDKGIIRDGKFKAAFSLSAVDCCIFASPIFPMPDKNGGNALTYGEGLSWGYSSHGRKKHWQRHNNELLEAKSCAKDRSNYVSANSVHLKLPADLYEPLDGLPCGRKLGVNIFEASSVIGKRTGLLKNGGILVSVLHGCNGQIGGLNSGDVILSVNPSELGLKPFEIDSYYDLESLVKVWQISPWKKVTFTVMRGAEKLELEIDLGGTRPKETETINLTTTKVETTPTTNTSAPPSTTTPSVTQTAPATETTTSAVTVATTPTTSTLSVSASSTKWRDAKDATQAQRFADEIQASIVMFMAISDVVKQQPLTMKDRVLSVVDSEIVRLQQEKQLLQDLLSSRFSTPIRPNNANLSVSAFRAADTFPKIPFYVPGTNEIGEMLVVPRVSDDGYLNYQFDFLDPTSAYDKVRDSIDVAHDDIGALIFGLNEIDEWTKVAQENNVNRRIEKTASCIPDGVCKEKKQGVSSTEVVFQIYEDGSTAGRIQRNKGKFMVGYNMSVESSILLSAYLIYMRDVGATEFNIGVMSDDEVKGLFN